MAGQMNKTPTVSVIVPVYHVEKVLRRCLDSLLRQTFSDYEIILINDGGNETETTICEEYAAKHPLIQYQYQENQGVSVARNTGLSMARGSWIMFVDSDDWVNENFVLKAFAAVNNNKAQMAIFDLVYTIGDSRNGKKYSSLLEEVVYPAVTILKGCIVGDIAGYVWNKIYKRELWDGILFPPGEIWEDVAVLHEVIDRADKIAILHDVLCYIVHREGCITDVAFRTGDCHKWSYIQRKKRYQYIKNYHAELLDVVNNDIASAAVGYAGFLAKNEDNLQNVYDISKWLRTQKIQLNDGRMKRRIAFFLLLHFPKVFFYSVKILLPLGLVKR